MKYFVVVQAPAWSLGPGRFAVESAFASHLTELRQQVGTTFDELVLVGPSMSPEQYAGQAAQLAEVAASETGVRFVPGFHQGGSRPAFLLTGLWPMWRRLRRLFREPCVVQSGMSTELARPLMFLACLAARANHRHVVFIVDMDFRRHAERFRATGQWGLASYLVNRWVYDPLKGAQLWLAPRLFDLCLMKGEGLVRHYGRGRTNVRSFYDTAYGAEDVIPAASLEARLQARGEAGSPLVATHFGRLAPNKGVDRMIAAVAAARSRGADVRLRVIGDGPCLPALQAQAVDSGVAGFVDFLPPVTYGASLFAEIDRGDVMLAAPLVEDTPRAAFDAFARGLPVVAFDISYFRDLATASGAVVPVPWPDVGALSDALVALAEERARVTTMARRAREFAVGNTQSVWLERRVGWLREIAGKSLVAG